jgi:hypothetical protein
MTVESRKVVPIWFLESLVKSYPMLPQIKHYDHFQKAETPAGRRVYAIARTNNNISDTPGDQRVLRLDMVDKSTSLSKPTSGWMFVIG